jgi:hypothetical protein
VFDLIGDVCLRNRPRDELNTQFTATWISNLIACWDFSVLRGIIIQTLLFCSILSSVVACTFEFVEMGSLFSASYIARWGRLEEAGLPSYLCYHMALRALSPLPIMLSVS